MTHTGRTLLGIVFVLSGCGGSDGTGRATDVAVLGDPLVCLEGQGLRDAEERADDLWRAWHDGPEYLVTIKRLSSTARARRLKADAIDVYVAQAGPYVVVGPAKPSAGGLVVEDEGLEALRLVRRVATCVGG